MLIVGFVDGCGYRPSAKYSREITGQKISTSVVISAQDPENTVLIKDAVDSAIIEIFHASLVDRKEADTHLQFSISPPRYTPIEYDDNGFVIAYRATILLNILRQSQDVLKRYKAKGTYDFAIAPNAIITDKERFDAIKYSAQKAIASFVAQVSAEGSRKGE
jgi:hypothetical protein